MQILLVKMISLIMPVVVLLSGAFPSLFGGKEYINPDSDAVQIVAKEVTKDGAIIKDYESFAALGDLGLAYSKEFFENNSLAVITAEYQDGDELYLKSIYKDGTEIKIEYIVIESNLTALYCPAYVTWVVEVEKDVESVQAIENDEYDKFNFVLIDWFRNEE